MTTSKQLKLEQQGKTGFTLMAPLATGVVFTNSLAQDRHLTNQILLNGSGVAAGDVDGDGWCDLYFCGLDSSNALYRNTGDWRFQDVTATSGVSCPNLDATGAVLADLEGDGDLDLVVNSVGGGTHLFFNNGKGKFSQGPILNERLGGMSSALADIDGDGDLDIYVANYRTVTLRDQPNTKFTFRVDNGQHVLAAVDGRPVTEPDLANRFDYMINTREGGFRNEENGEADTLFRNDGQGKFTPLSPAEAFQDDQGRPLKAGPFDWGLSVIFRDLNGDRAPDIYVCNDFRSPDRIWMNDGRGRFRPAAPLVFRQTCLFSMGMDVADINRDGFDDLYIVDMLSRDHRRRHTQRIDIKPEVSGIGEIENRPQYPRNMLLLNRGDHTFSEIAQFSGVEATEWSWTPVFLDVDLDGYEDLLVSNGFERDGMNVDILQKLEEMKRQQKRSAVDQLRLRTMFPRLATANLAFRNLGNLKFAETSLAWGFSHEGISQGMICADLDNDGDLDLAVNNLNEAPLLYRNESVAARVLVRLHGQPPNTSGIGARINITGGPVAQSQEIMSGGRYLSSDEAVRVFAAGRADMTIEVAWRSGRNSLVTGVQPNRAYDLTEPADPVTQALPSTNAPAPLFHDVSVSLQHRHAEDPFDDFAVQPLLPKRLSQLGPGLAWFDIDDDGWDDLMIASGRGGLLSAYRNNGRGGFERMKGGAWDQAVTRDQTTVVGLRRPDGERIVFAGSANFEDGVARGSVAREYNMKAPRVVERFSGQASSTGPLALGDLDGDGILDLFVGGRVLPGHYAAPASSLIFRGSRTADWKLDELNSRVLDKVGMVSGAVWSDLDGNGQLDLILAIEAGPVRVFINSRGRLQDASPAWGLTAYRGWWNGVTTADVNGDDRMDVVASNWGHNSRYERYASAPVRLWTKDIDGDGRSEYIEGYADPRNGKLWPLQQFHVVGAALPLLRERIGTFDRYARATIDELYTPPLPPALEVNWFDSTVFINRGSVLEPTPLPVEAQLAPAFGIGISDFDGDGHEDIFLGQNFFATDPETSRYDAGRGLLLRGDGTGNFVAAKGHECGVTVYGEQRGVAVCDYDADGRVDLAIAQNGATTVLLRNAGARPGLRVRLVGSPDNRAGIGAALRLRGARSAGPMREIHAGAGYWSQDSAVTVLTGVDVRQDLWIRWPGGKETVTAVPEGARTLAVGTDGKIITDPR